MRNGLILLITILIFGLTSCSKNDNLLTEMDIDNSQLSFEEEVDVNNGRLYFPTKAVFQDYYKTMKKKGDVEIANILDDKFYQHDFYSLKPIVNSNTEQKQVSRHLDRIKSKSSGVQTRTNLTNTDIIDHLDDLDDLFGEDVFMSLLNQNAELQVGSEIYKYTDAGLFIVNESKLDGLYSFLHSENISKDLLLPTSRSTVISFSQTYNPNGGLTNIGDYQYFLANLEENGGSGGGSGGTPPPTNTPGYELANIANSMEQCNINNPWLGNIFGTVKTCTDQYESERRVRTKYSNIDFFLAFTIGVKTKHQKKGFMGFWNKENTEEVAMGINSLTWRFDFPSTLLNQAPARIYLHNGKMFETTAGYFNSVYAGDAPMPSLPFENKIDMVIEVAIDAPFIGLSDEEDVRKFFYDNLFDVAKNTLESFGDRDLNGIGVVMSTTFSTWVQFYDFSNSCTNCDKQEKTIDWGIVSPQFTYTFGSGGGGSWGLSNFNFDFKNPDLTGMTAFGMAKRGGSWHGHRMTF